MDYKPTEYDCEVCSHGQAQNPDNGGCIRDDAFTFLCIARWYHIKGIDRLLRAYIEEFRADDDVRLVIKTTSNNQFDFAPQRSARRIISEMGYPDPPEIGFVTQPLETQYLYDLMGMVDCFVQPSRAECFGIAQLQAAYCETPVIYTDWSAQAEVFDASNDGLLPIEEYTVEHPRSYIDALPYNVHREYPPDANWATPSVEALQRRLREMYADPDIDARGDAASAYVEEAFDWADAVDARLDRLRTVVDTSDGLLASLRSHV